MLDTDTLFQERYRISYVADERPGCIVYRAYDQREQQHVLIAELSQEDDTTLAHTRSLAEAVAAVQAAGFLAIRKHFARDLAYYMLVDDPGGQDLERALHEDALLAAAQSAPDRQAMLEQGKRLLHLVGAFHQQAPPLLLGDLQASDLWVSPSDELFLAPFALLRPVGAGPTPYRAPELEDGTGAPTTASDIYALGAVCYHLLAGWPPPTAALRLGGTPLNPLRTLNEHVSPLLDQVILRALDLSPGERHQAVHEMSAALDVIPLLESLSTYETLPAPAIAEQALASEQQGEAAEEHGSEEQRHADDAPQPDEAELPSPATCLITAVVFLFLTLLVLAGLTLFFMIGPGQRFLLHPDQYQQAAAAGHVLVSLLTSSR